MSNAFYNTIRGQVVAPGLVDLMFFLPITMIINPATAQTVELQAAKGPDVNTYPGASASYFVLQSLAVSRRSDWRKYHGFREGLSNIQSVAIPVGNGAQNFQLLTSQAITALGFVGWSVASANLVVNFINLDRNDGINQQVTVVPQISASVNALISLVPQYGPYGFEALGPTSGGLRAIINFGNATGSPQSVNLIMTGSRFAGDIIFWDLYYTPPTGVGNVIAGVKTFPLMRSAYLDEGPVYIPINLQLPGPLMDPGNPNFGTLTLVPNMVDNPPPYDTDVTIDVVVYGSMLYQLPGG